VVVERRKFKLVSSPLTAQNMAWLGRDGQPGPAPWVSYNIAREIDMVHVNSLCSIRNGVMTEKHVHFV
jgi:hypothetical protein